MIPIPNNVTTDVAPQDSCNCRTSCCFSLFSRRRDKNHDCNEKVSGVAEPILAQDQIVEPRPRRSLQIDIPEPTLKPPKNRKSPRLHIVVDLTENYESQKSSRDT